MNLSMLLQPIPSASVAADPMKSMGLSNLARKLDSIPLPGISSLRPNSVGHSKNSAPLRNVGVSEVVVRPDHLAHSHGRAMYGKLPHSHKLSAKSSARRSRKTSSAAGTPLPLSALAEVYLPEASTLSRTGLFTPIPEDLYTSAPTDQSSQLTVSALDTSKHDVDPASHHRPESASPARAPARSDSPMRTRGSARNSRQSSRRVDTKPAQEVVVPPPEPVPVTTVENWAQCENCKKWRRLPASVNTDNLPDLWVCSLNIWDPLRNSCDVPEETVNDINHDSSALQVELPLDVADSKVSVPIRPVTVTHTGGRSHSDRLMDHEVLEMLFSSNRDHPLHNRLTIHSLDKNSLLAAELPHEIVSLEEPPSAATMGLSTLVGHDPNDLIRPEDDLIKEDNIPRDDGVLSIGFASKTHWPSQDNDASTIDSAEDLDSNGKAPVSILSTMFPQLAMQVSKLDKPTVPSRTRRSSKLEKSLESKLTNKKNSNVNALSAMNHEDISGIFTSFANRTIKTDTAVPKTHCLLEQKLRSSTLPMDSFLQPLSMLAIPLVYPNTDASKDHTTPRQTRYSSRSSRQLETPRSSEPDLVPSKPDSKRKTPTRGSKTSTSDRHLRKLRDDYVRSSTGKSHSNKLAPQQDDLDYLREPKRHSRRTNSRYARPYRDTPDLAATLSMDIPLDIVNSAIEGYDNSNHAVATSGHVPRNHVEPNNANMAPPTGRVPTSNAAPTSGTGPTNTPLDQVGSILLAELSTPIDYVPPSGVAASITPRDTNPFGLSRAMELLTQPIDMAAVPPASTANSSGSQQPACTFPTPPDAVLNFDKLSKPIF
ncbi:CW-type Zinc Finger protein [Babesia ovis]|uniref:CW-type Zinc Finger protein n=1 Tax=Babesia ovis TaxID=5869 RepID=A0A9W5T8X3_BABOV|nr:CW-type Zinc Finger protein [Babesia ovis]